MAMTKWLPVFWTTMTLLSTSFCCRPSVEEPAGRSSANASASVDRQITSAPYGHILTNVDAWSPDSKWLYYDVRSDPAGSVFDGSRIERVEVATGRVETVYESRNGAHCGVVSCSPVDGRIIFIRGPENPTPDWTYAANHREGVIVDVSARTTAVRLDARDLVSPFTPGALRGGTHLHVFDGHGEWVSFTYEDAVVAPGGVSPGLRYVGVSVPGHDVRTSKSSDRNHDADYFSVLVTALTPNPQPGSDEIKRASEEGWVGSSGYQRSNGSRQPHAIAFQGQVVTTNNATVTELFVVDIPAEVTIPGANPLQGTSDRMPAPPRGCVQRRLTHTVDREYPGIQGPRHWTHSSSDGSRIAFLMRDDAGIVQVWTVSPNGGPVTQLTHNSFGVASAFSWTRDGTAIAYAGDNSIFLTEINSGSTRRLTPRSSDETAPRPEACVLSPDGNHVAYVRRTLRDGEAFNQIYLVDCR